MRIARRFSGADRKQWDGAVGGVPAAAVGDGGHRAEAPAGWSHAARAALRRHGFRATGIAARLRPVPEDDVPRFLWRRVPDEAALGRLASAARERGETGAQTVFARIAGGLAYWGWKGGYFDAEADAAAFFDELRVMMARQMAAPEAGRWRGAGLNWAYGIETDAAGLFIADYRTGRVGRAGAIHETPHGASLHGADDTHRNAARIADLCAPGGPARTGDTASARDGMASARDDTPSARADTASDDTGWTRDGAGIRFDTARLWHTCPRSGPLMRSTPGGEFMFAEDTACAVAIINPASFVSSGGLSDAGGSDAGPLGAGQFDADGFAHAVRLWAVALDISAMMTAQPTRTIAAGVWDHRPIGIGLTNLDGFLMASGVAYDGAAGRALAAAIAALMTGTAYAVSAELAAQMGAFPEFDVNRRPMLQTIANHRRAAHGHGGGYPGMARPPVPLDAGSCRDAGLVQRARLAWDRALAGGEAAGYRNAQVTLMPACSETDALLGCAGGGALVRCEALPGGRYTRIVNPYLPRGLASLGHDAARIDAIVSHVAGTGSLDGAPAINHASLRALGVDDRDRAALEAALMAAPDIRRVFTRVVLGARTWRRLCALTGSAATIRPDALLAALGFSDDDIEAANAHCCGAMSVAAAPHLDPAHRAVFETASGGSGRRGRDSPAESAIRMMAALQPFLSGGIGWPVQVPVTATLETVRALAVLGWRLGLRGLRFERVGAPAQPEPAADKASRPSRSRFAVYEQGEQPGG